MLVLGILIGLWVGVPVGVLLVAMLGPRENEVFDPRAMRGLLARHYPSDAAGSSTPKVAARDALAADSDSEQASRRASR